MRHEFKLQDPGEGVHEVEVEEVLVAEGDSVSEGDDVLVVESDKAAIELPSPFSGRIAEMRVAVGDIVEVGEVLMVIDDAAEEVAEETEEVRDTGETRAAEASGSDAAAPDEERSNAEDAAEEERSSRRDAEGDAPQASKQARQDTRDTNERSRGQRKHDTGARGKAGFPWLLTLCFGLLLCGLGGGAAWLLLTTPAQETVETAARESDATAPSAADPDTPREAPAGDSGTAEQEIAIADPAERFAQPGEIVLPQAPDPRVSETAGIGVLPRTGDAGETPLAIYARPFNRSDPRPRIALLLNGLGLSAAATQQAVEDMPGPVTLGYVAFADDLQTLIDDARAAGHETVLAVPMEPRAFPRNDAGPNALLSDQTEQERLIALRLSLAQATGYIGIAPFMGEALLADAEALRPVMQEISARGLLFADTRPGLLSEAPTAAALADTPLVVSALQIDAAPNGPAIDAALAELETLAVEQGAALGVFSPLPVSYDRILNWAAGLAGRGLVLAPVSALYDSPDASPTE